MKTTVAIFLVIVAIALLTLQFTPTEKEEPKLSYHAVFFYLCGRPEGILITTEPPTWVSDFYPPSDVQELLIEMAIEAKQTVSVFMARSECPKPKVKA